MVFSEIEVKRIDKLIGEYCRNLVPLHLSKEIRYNYRIKSQNVLLYEERPSWNNPTKWLALDFAKLRYIRQHGTWRLYWMRASGKWITYEPKDESKSLEILIDTIKQDEYGCFFG